MSALLQDPVDLENVRINSPQGERDPQAVVHASSGAPSCTASGYSGVEEKSTPAHSFLEHSTTILYPILLVPALYFACNRLHELELLWLAALAIPLALVLADFVGGVVHWAADTYFSEETPVVGPAFIKPFRQHHIFPRDICTHKLVSLVGNVCIVAAPFLGLCLYLLWATEDALVAFVILCTALMSSATVVTNLFHKWAHQEKPSAGVRCLQRTRLVLEPRHHQIHHQEPFEMHYCITNGWLNPLLNKSGFFRKLEAALRSLRIEPTNSRDKGDMRM